MVPFKEVSFAIMTFEKKTGLQSGQDKIIVAPHVDPNRQVYVLATFYQNEKKEFHKFIVYDAETKDVLAKGSREKTFVNPFEKD